MTSRTVPGFSVVMPTRLTSMAMTAVLIAATLAASIGCGGQTSPTAPQSQASPAPSPPSVPSPGWTTISVPAATNGEAGVYRTDVTMAGSGTATVMLRWPDADFSLQLYVTNGPCADTTRLVAGGCAIVGTTRPGTLPGLVTSRVTVGDVNTIWVLNPDHPRPQSFWVDLRIE